MKLVQTYINEQIDDYGQIEEYEDKVSYCPYCGHDNDWNFEHYDELDFVIKTCSKCNQQYLEQTEIDTKFYTITKRIEH